MKKIWVDLDDVLADSTIQIISYMNKIRWSNNNISDVSDYYWREWEKLALTKQEAIDLHKEFWLTDYKYNIIPVEWSIQGISYLKTKFSDIYLITARREEYSQYTIDWLNKYFPNIFKDIIYVNHFTDKHMCKSDVCKNLWVSYMIDDYHDTCIKVSEKDINSVLYTRPWNANFSIAASNMKRVNSWDEIMWIF